jgi:hypothetical protein
MADFFTLYISAATDLERERDLLGRLVTEIPVTLGWRIHQSPSHGEPPDLDAVVHADAHLLLLGSDIRAPIGLEWSVSRRAGRRPVLLLKEDTLRTPAAEEFVRYLGGVDAWKIYKDSADLRWQVLLLLAGHILDRAEYFTLSPEEYEGLKTWRGELESAGKSKIEETRGGAGESSIILTTERYIPSEGVLIQPKKDLE